MGKAYKHVAVDAAKRIAETFDKDMVIILAYDAAHMKTHTTTYGKEPADKEAASMLGDRLTVACGADFENREVSEDFHREPTDSPIQIEDSAALAELIVSAPTGHPRSDEVIDEMQLMLSKLNFITETAVCRWAALKIIVEARSTSELHRLLPAYKQRIREVLLDPTVLPDRREETS